MNTPAVTADTDPIRSQQFQGQAPLQPRNNHNPSPPNTAWPLERPKPPTRSATLGTPDSDRNLASNTWIPQSRSEDLNHSFSSSPQSSTYLTTSPRPSPAFLSSAGSSRPSTPGGIQNLKPRSSSGHSDDSDQHLSVNSHVSGYTASSSHSNAVKQMSVASSTSASLASSTCSACGKPMQGQFVRALGTVFHLNCFKCMDCGEVVAQKFFPIEGSEGKQHPLCERDYFRRLNLICAKCGSALRGSYITACNKKFHVEHFTCSVCPILFGPQDSYYEHDGDVYCHFHYSTRFATKCAGCNSAILKQFVEINRNMRDECWHPECYMINKFWNVKVVSRRPTSVPSGEGDSQEPFYLEEERKENAASLREKQVRMEQQVYRIWTVLSAFEESSAACISDMLRQVSNGQYLDAIRMAEKFILHVEVLFATIDDLEFHFARLGMKGMSHVREARMLCRKTVELFTLLSHTQETGARRMGMTQELLALVTGLAHYLKILIRIALTGALKLEREQSVREAMTSFLDKLHLLAVQGGNPAARRMIRGESPFAPSAVRDNRVSSQNPPSDLCVKCDKTVEEDCIRLGTYQRWHSNCIQCAVCGKIALVAIPKEQSSKMETASFGEVPKIIYCTEHSAPNCQGGFLPVQRLEQYAFLLNVALRRLYLLLKKQGVVPLSPVVSSHGEAASPTGASDPYRNSEYRRVTNVERKISATARLPKRSTIIESPAGKIAHPSDLGQPGQRPHEVNVQHQHANGQVLRPAFARNNTEVMILEDSGPNSPTGGEDHQFRPASDTKTFSLGDIHSIVEAAQAREQHRSLPRETSLPYIAELSALELAIVKHFAVLALTRSPLKDSFDLDELLEMVEPKKSNFWQKLFKNDKKNPKKKVVFGERLEVLVEREGADSLLGTSEAPLRVPSFIDDVISAMRTMDMSVEGIFRKNGNIRRLNATMEAIDRDPSSVDFTQDNPVQLAALLKKFLGGLPEPLMTFKLHRLFVASQNLPSDEDRKRYLHLISLIMPKPHRDTMEVLFVFLKWVASFAHMDSETGNLMDLPNLATVIAPSIMRARGRDPGPNETFGALRVVTKLLENQDEFFLVPEELVPMLQDQEYFTNFMELTGKDFLKKCETYVKVKGTGRPPPSNGHYGNGPSNGTSRHPLMMTSPTSERPPPNTPFGSDPRSRHQTPMQTPHPMQTNMSPSNDPHVSPNSPSLPQAMAQNLQRTPPMEEWHAPPRIRDPHAPSSRPPSFSDVPRPSLDNTQASSSSPHLPSTNGYPSAVRQRT
ncbi:Rho-type GTPase-activating protein 1 [Leucoagaricus sp. SymC.cos]|nr:Rho-type GTPase-activating protein 1 [Leucoagaricus sp. SymC.cos]